MFVLLPESHKCWGSPEFDRVFKHEVAMLDKHVLPLQQALQHSSAVAEDEISVVILSKSVEADDIIVKTGVFYLGIVAGCQCADDPSTDAMQNEYCEIVFCINSSGQASVTLVS